MKEALEEVQSDTRINIEEMLRESEDRIVERVSRRMENSLDRLTQAQTDMTTELEIMDKKLGLVMNNLKDLAKSSNKWL